MFKEADDLALFMIAVFLIGCILSWIVMPYLSWMMMP